MQLSSITPGLNLNGVEPVFVVSVVAVTPVGPDSYKLIYQRPAGDYRDRLVSQADADAFSVAVAERPWAFDGNGEDFKLAVEAKRIDLAFLFDPMMAVHTSSVQPLPHQIAAVYESMLPRQPLRYVLADDPGAGKTIMAGLYIRELLMRADARRVLIISRAVSPNSGGTNSTKSSVWNSKSSPRNCWPLIPMATLSRAFTKSLSGLIR